MLCIGGPKHGQHVDNQYGYRFSCAEHNLYGDISPAYCSPGDCRADLNVTYWTYKRQRLALHDSPVYLWFWAIERLSEKDACRWFWEHLCSANS